MNIRDTDQIKSEDAIDVLYVMTGEGMKPGSFRMNLVNAAMSADLTNSAKLMLSFPGVVQAVNLARNVDDGMYQLRVIAYGKVMDK